MVCDHCSSASHVTGYRECPNYCTVCKDVGHTVGNRKNKACPNRTCPRCNTVGHSARECTFCSLCEQQGHKEANCPDRLCSACNSSLHKTSKSSPYHHYSTCDEMGHSEKNCPQADCDVCNLFGHVDTICPFRDCWDVAIDWLNILLLCRTQFTISAYFSDG